MCNDNRMVRFANLILLFPGLVASFVPSSSITHRSFIERKNPKIVAATAAPGSVDAYTAELRNALEQSRTAVVDRLSLEERDRLDIAESETSAEVRSYASEAANVAWVSALEVSSPGFARVSLTCWNGPLLDVPHMALAAEVASSGTVDVIVSFCPRADGGWDGEMADGSFPEPTSREMFAERGVRAAQMEAFFTSEMRGWAEGIYGLPGATRLERGVPLGCSGPVRVEVRLPGPDAVGAVFREATDAYLGWMEAAEVQGQVKSMLTYAHDCRVRPLFNAVVAARLEERLGERLGGLLAQQDAGPADLADRSAAMTDAAKTNFEIDHMVEATQSD